MGMGKRISPGKDTGRALMCIPSCPTCKVQMRYWDPRHQTAEQRWAGTWYKCEHCQSAVLFMSSELARFASVRRNHDHFRARLKRTVFA